MHILYPQGFGVCSSSYKDVKLGGREGGKTPKIELASGAVAYGTRTKLNYRRVGAVASLSHSHETKILIHTTIDSNDMNVIQASSVKEH